MKESMSVAKTVAWNLLNEETKNKLKKNKNYGIHIHCPDTSTPKDGPSAGIAITLAILSLFTDTEINNKIGITGEIDLNGSALKIGGLEKKIDGAKTADVELVLCPKENNEDLKIIRSRKNPPEDSIFKILTINNIKEAINIVFKNDIYKYLNI